MKRQEISLRIDYKRLQSLEYELNKLDGITLQQDFSDQIDLVASGCAGKPVFQGHCTSQRTPGGCSGIRQENAENTGQGDQTGVRASERD